MGRSVNYARNSSAVAYIYLERDETEDAYFEYENFMEDIKNILTGKYPTLRECNYWEGKEVHFILENGLFKFAVSEYCGLVSVSLVPVDREDSSNNLCEALAKKVAPHFLKLMEKSYGENCLRKLGSFSNGEGVFERAK